MTTTLAQSGLSAKDSKKIKRLNLLLYGPYKAWKTVTAHQLPRTRTLDFDNGMQSVEWAILAGVLNRRMEDIVYESIIADRPSRYGLVERINVAVDQVDEWVQEEDVPPGDWDKDYPQHWDTLIIDSATFLVDSAIDMALNENKRLKLSESLNKAEKGLRKGQRLFIKPMVQQDWGGARQLFGDAMTQWLQLGKNVVLTAHERVETDDDGSITAYVPNLIGQDRSKIPAMFDEVWYSFINPGSKNKPASVEFRTEQEYKRPLGSRLGCLNAREPANFPAIKEKVCEFYGVPPERVWTAYHGEEGRARAEREAREEAESI